MTVSDAALRLGYDPRHWTTTDGHEHVSIPAGYVPMQWARVVDDKGHLVYVSGQYSIVRLPYGQAAWSYTVYREGVELSSSLSARLTDAKARAVKNAEGRDVVNVA